ncbi:DUF3152 domain-containing protein [Streptomyces sp. CG1]|uniref:DUF3152 domain-containing protein n=1 Tax=Streptomyces sp. CG1 TaxID=1287523 RepID=UPI0034E24C92
MGRHSRRGPAPKDDSADITAHRKLQQDTRPGDGRNVPGQGGASGAPYGEGAYGAAAARSGQPLLPGQRQAPMGGTPAHGVPRLPDGTPAHGVPRFPDGTPARGVPRFHEGAPARGGHPEQREAGGGWGEFAGAAGPGAVLPRQRPAEPGARPGAGPRQEYLDAFADGRGGPAGADEDIDVFAPRKAEPRPAEERPAGAPEAGAPEGARGTARATTAHPQSRDDGSASQGALRGRTLTGIAAAAVTTVLAVIVAGQVAKSQDADGTQSRSASDQARDASPEGGRTPSASPGTVALSYEQKMDRKYPLSVTLKGSGKFDAVPGFAKAPGTGRKYTYRVDVEQGMGLDGELFAEAVQKTLNDDRSWAHAGARTFERISSGKPDFVITLASPGTTAQWCAKSGLDTTEDNVSCDSASTERVMINAYRWAQGSETYGDKIYPYRQMLINHEVGHRLGYGHVSCQKNGELAPVMQQQTKFLDHDGIHCLPNPWPFPTS